MSFNPDLIFYIIFSHKTKKRSYPLLILINSQVIQTPYQKYFSFFLDEKLKFGKHLRYIGSKVNASIELLHKLQIFL